MILSNILKAHKNLPDNSKVTHTYVEKLTALLFLLNRLKSTKTLAQVLKEEKSKSLYSKFDSNNSIKNSSDLKFKIAKESLISYIININLSPTNTLVNVTDVKGNPKLSFSAGLIKLTKKQKKAQPMALINIFKVLLLKARFLKDKPVALHFKNTKVFYESLIIRVLKDRLFIKSIQSYNLSPHNGCRPKKLKRIKRRTKRMILR
jgi:ribosomal protein S11|tara:strand:- start:8965 stop:9579 length:615 start_codon:yes stop_codon:yes gene_type:complete